jgi:integrase
LIKRRIDTLAPPMPSWVLHDIRRTVASGMARLGINLPVIEKLLNHVSGSFAGIVGVYQRHSFSDEKRAAITAWARHVEQIVTGEAGNVVQLRGGPQ